MSEGVAFSLVLLLALYGVGCLLHRLTERMLRPCEKLHRFSVVYLRKDTQNSEQIVRFFRLKAEKGDVLFLVDNGVSEHEKEVIRRLCEGRRDVRFLETENFVEENCNYRENTI